MRRGAASCRNPKPQKWVACLDLESVLIPELWPALGKALARPELALTTRQIPDKAALNRLRLRALKETGVTTGQIEKVIARLRPLKGASEFLRWVSRRMRVCIVSDCFRELAAPLLKCLAGSVEGRLQIFAPHWRVRAGKVVGLPQRIRAADTKTPVVRAFQRKGYQVFAVGDSLNDIGMLRAAERGIFFRPSPRARLTAPELSIARTYSQLKKISFLS